MVNHSLRRTGRGRASRHRTCRVAAALCVAVVGWHDVSSAALFPGELTVEISQRCGIDSACQDVFLVEGSNFEPGSRLNIFIPGAAVVGVDDIEIERDEPVRPDGTIDQLWHPFACRAVPNPTDAPGLFWVVADDARSGERIAIYPIDRGYVVCEPPFVDNNSDPHDCDIYWCMWLTVDSGSSIGVHWSSGSGYPDHVITYSLMGSGNWTTTDVFRDDVGDVAVNNLESEVTYAFWLAGCDDTCGEWTFVGYAATA